MDNYSNTLEVKATSDRIYDNCPYNSPLME